MSSLCIWIPLATYTSNYEKQYSPHNFHLKPRYPKQRSLFRLLYFVGVAPPTELSPMVMAECAARINGAAVLILASAALPYINFSTFYRRAMSTVSGRVYVPG
jgi:hypothetical protein